MEFTVLYFRWLFNFLSLFPENTSAENHCKNNDPYQTDGAHTANRSLHPAAFAGLRYSTGNHETFLSISWDLQFSNKNKRS